LGGSQGARKINSLILNILTITGQNYYVYSSMRRKKLSRRSKQESQFILKGLDIEIASRYKLHSLLSEEEMTAALEITEFSSC